LTWTFAGPELAADCYNNPERHVRPFPVLVSRSPNPLRSRCSVDRALREMSPNDHEKLKAGWPCVVLFTQHRAGGGSLIEARLLRFAVFEDHGGVGGGKGRFFRDSQDAGWQPPDMTINRSQCDGRGSYNRQIHLNQSLSSLLERHRASPVPFLRWGMHWRVHYRGVHARLWLLICHLSTMPCPWE
jgi:hypothetical protein